MKRLRKKICYIRFYLRPRFIFREIRKGNLGVIFKVFRKAMHGL
ncbi:MAG: hypothetical protein NZ872_00275 [Archaeoglobaceae archaeon]|nr:hypothetical protein [Archaeoglobaceae archaeon]MDW8127636.1 hypothetical protein [Archaeoglobaceae archaeon]